jgi:hypothetical protein
VLDKRQEKRPNHRVVSPQEERYGFGGPFFLGLPRDAKPVLFRLKWLYAPCMIYCFACAALAISLPGPDFGLEVAGMALCVCGAIHYAVFAFCMSKNMR